MKLSINQSELQQALTTVSKGTASRATLPILSGILFKASGDSLVLEGTNLDLSIRCTANALIEEEGMAVIPAKLIVDVIKSLPDAAIHIEADDESAQIICDSTSFSLKTMAAQDFPGFPTVAEDQSIDIPFDLFSSMVKRVAKVVSRDESRAILTGVLLHAEDGIVKMVATDSYRLAVTETDVEGINEPFEVVVGGSFLQDVASLPAAGATISVAAAENQIIITCQNTTFVNRRIEGNYPNYQQLLPDSYTTRACFDTVQLADAVKRTSLLSNRTAPVRLDVNGESQTIQLSTTSQDIGAAHETLGATIEGEDTEIAFNFAYVLEGLASVETAKVFLELQGSMKPGIFRAEDKERYLYLIMPVRLS